MMLKKTKDVNYGMIKIARNIDDLIRTAMQMGANQPVVI